MPFSSTVTDRERDKFVEHPNGETSVRVKVSNPEDISGGGGGSSAATIPTIYNLSMPIADTEYSQALGASTKQILIRLRDRTARAKIAFVSGDTSILFLTLEAGTVYSQENLNLTGATIYLQANKVTTAEILEWK